MSEGRRGSRIGLSLLAGTALLLCAPAYAQDADSDAEASSGFDDIVITARKREESAQDVPVPVTALDAEMIEQLDLTSIERISARTPNLTVGRASNGSGAQITLRGIGSSSTSIGIEQSVAVVVDGAYYGQGRVINEGFLDLGSVEIINGPQALFYGRNATAGVISINTADPGDEPEFILRAGYEFEAERSQIEAILSGPLSDTFGARLALRYSDMSGGYFENRATPQDITYTDTATGDPFTETALPAASDGPGEQEFLARLTLVWEPLPWLSNELKVSYGQSENDNASWNYVLYNCATGVSSLNPSVPCEEEFNIYQNNFIPVMADFPYSRSDGSLFNEYESRAVNNTLEIDLGVVAITSVTNYQWNQNIFAITGDFQSSAIPTWATENSEWEAWSEEIRALTNFDGSLNFMIGFLYQETTRTFDQPIWFPFLVTDSTAPPGLEAVTVRKNSDTEGESYAVFGQAIWDITPDIELAGGIRYTHETKDSSFAQVYVHPAAAAIFIPSSDPVRGIIEADQSFNDISPEITLTWRPSEDLMIYGAYREAYKSGGFSNGGLNSAFSSDPLGDLTFDEETASGYEVGFRSTFFDRQMRLNATAFRYEYEDLQVDFFNSSIIAFQTLTGDARTQGFEIQFDYVPAGVPGLNLRAALNYTDAEYTSFPVAPCFAGQTPTQGCNLIFDGGLGEYRTIAGAEVGERQDLSGAPLSMAADWTGQVGFDYEAPLTQNLYFGLGADLRFTSDYIPSGFGQTASEQDGYTTLDAIFRVGSNNDHWELALIGKNLTNEFYVTGVVDGPSTGSGTGTAAGIQADQIGFAALPRTLELRATLRF
jgi:outer membrane receptor protein involved in Fe transport